jgi:tetratricopeptide (TPR) repeat protein
MADDDSLPAHLEGKFAIFLSYRSTDGTSFLTRYVVGRKDVVDDWSSEPVARAAVAALAAALAESGAAPLEGCVEELHDAMSGETYQVASRRVHASEGFAHPPGSAAAALQKLVALDGGTVSPATLLLTHVFELPGDAPQRLRLATLVLPSGRLLAELAWLQAAIFGADAHVALSSPKDCVFTDVSFGDAGSLSADELAALPSTKRDALRAALRSQRLAATAACIEARWSAGFRALLLGVAAMKPALGPALFVLATRLAAPQSGGGHTRESIDALIVEAEALEAAGRFLEAAALYKQCLDANARNPGAHLLRIPPNMWAYYGLALMRAGRFREARAAYDAGLRALELGCYIEPDTPEWRETMRLRLYRFIVTLGQTMRDQAVFGEAFLQIFPEQLKQFQAAGERVSIGGNDETMEIIGEISGRRFGVVHRLETEGPNAGLRLGRVEELPRVNPASTELETPGIWSKPLSAQRCAAANLANARENLTKHDMAAVPKLPQARCALCSEAASKRCSACGVPAYCGPACQKAHWKVHKPECKAARAASAAKKAA